MTRRMRKGAKELGDWFRSVDNDLKLAGTIASMLIFLWSTFALKSEVKAQFDAKEENEREFRMDLKENLGEIKDSVKRTESRVYDIYTHQGKVNYGTR